MKSVLKILTNPPEFQTLYHVETKSPRIASVRIGNHRPCHVLQISGWNTPAFPRKSLFSHFQARKLPDSLQMCTLEAIFSSFMLYSNSLMAMLVNLSLRIESQELLHIWRSQHIWSIFLFRTLPDSCIATNSHSPNLSKYHSNQVKISLGLSQLEVFSIS